MFSLRAQFLILHSVLRLTLAEDSAALPWIYEWAPR